ncbi:hypothetical protein ANO11243_016070 [Dothideomycetidae sp. 11243]|nr:hypothetical protein ANO11243_016070 [fungal sp. No.11243]
MSGANPAPRWRQNLAWMTGLLAIGSSIALIAVLIDISCAFGTTADHKAIILAAAVLNICSVLVLAALAAFLLLQLHGRQQMQPTTKWLLLGALVIISLVAVGLSFASLSLAHHDAETLPSTKSTQMQTLAAAGLALCCIHLACEACFLGFALSPVAPVREIRFSGDCDGSFVTSSELKNSPSTINKSTFADDEPGSPWPPLQSSFPTTPPKRNKVRESVSSFLQAKNSKTRLIRHASFQSTTTVSTERRDSWGRRPDDAFDSWVVDQDDPYVVRQPSYMPGRLDPIPASRPGSPAKPLDGPFPCNDDDDTPSSPIPPDSPTLSRRPPALLVRPPLGPRPSTADGASSEAHIHPLFRSDSPLTAPPSSPDSPRHLFFPPPTAYRPASAHARRQQMTGRGRPALRSVQSADTVRDGPVRANMPPRPHPGLYAEVV